MIEEKALFVWPNVADQQIRLDWVVVEEMLRRLHQAHALIVKKRHRAPQEIALRDEISVEKDDESGSIGLAAKNLECMIDISRLGVSIVGTRQIAGILAPTKLLDPRPSAIVEHPHAQTGKIDSQRTHNRPREDRLLFVIGCNQHVDSWRAFQAL